MEEHGKKKNMEFYFYFWQDGKPSHSKPFLPETFGNAGFSIRRKCKFMAKFTRKKGNSPEACETESENQRGKCMSRCCFGEGTNSGFSPPDMVAFKHHSLRQGGGLDENPAGSLEPSGVCTRGSANQEPSGAAGVGVLLVPDRVLPGSNMSPEPSNIDFASCAKDNCTIVSVMPTSRTRKPSLEKTFPRPRLHGLIAKAAEDELTIPNTPTRTHARTQKILQGRNIW